MASLLKPDLDQAARFLKLLDPTATKFTFQTFDDNKARKSPDLARISHGSLHDRAEQLTALNQQGAGVFVTVNATDFKGRRLANIVRVRAVWIEDDTGLSDPYGVIEPQIVNITSPDKYHLFFLVDGLTPGQHRGIQNTLIRDYGSDANAKDLTRVLRLPGFYHQKGTPHMVELSTDTGEKPYTAEEVLRAFPPSDPVKSKAAAAAAPEEPADYSPLTVEDSENEPLPDINLTNAVKYLPASFENRQDWLNVGAALNHQFEGADEALALFDDWSQQVDGYTGYEDVAKAWESFKRPKSGKLRTFRSLVQAYNTTHPDGWKGELESHVSKMNETHSSVVIGGRHKIMRRKTCGGAGYEYFNRRDLELLYDHTFIKIDQKAYLNGTIKDTYANHFLAWAKHPRAKTYTAGAGFLPGQKAPKDYFNTWEGFALEPKQNNGLLKPIHYHLEHIVCGDNAELYVYLQKWLAYGFQWPGKQAGTAIVLRSEKGSGKGTLGHFLRSIWGVHGLHISSAKYLVGNFNSHLAETCFLFADEAFFSGIKEHESVLKSLITEPRLTIERKGVDMISQPNYLKILMTANSDYVVPASRDERRYCVFDVISDRIGDTVYFDALG